MSPQRSAFARIAGRTAKAGLRPSRSASGKTVAQAITAGRTLVRRNGFIGFVVPLGATLRALRGAGVFCREAWP
jgi:hypothetical protein